MHKPGLMKKTTVDQLADTRDIELLFILIAVDIITLSFVLINFL